MVAFGAPAGPGSPSTVLDLEQAIVYDGLGGRLMREYTVVYQTVEDGWIMASVPELPGAVTQGRDMAEARSMIKEAVELLLASYQENAAKEAPSNAVWETLLVEPATAEAT